MPAILARQGQYPQLGATSRRDQHGRYLARHIPRAQYVELEGIDHPHFIGDSDAVIDEVQSLLTGSGSTDRSNGSWRQCRLSPAKVPPVRGAFPFRDHGQQDALLREILLFNKLAVLL